jgi:hypothetical protein
MFTCHLELSRRLRCAMASRHCCRLHLPSSALRRSDSGANRSVMRPRADCFTADQLLPHRCVPLGCLVPSLTKVSHHPTAPIDCYQGHYASHNIFASSSPAGTVGGHCLGRNLAA